MTGPTTAAAARALIDRCSYLTIASARRSTSRQRSRRRTPRLSTMPSACTRTRTTFEWTLGGAFLLQQASVPVPQAPDGLCLIGLDGGDGYTQHYFDSRGIARVYAMTFDGREWTLERRTADFTPLNFHQRWSGTFSDDGREIHGRFETSPDGREWQLDFELSYFRVG